LASKLPTSSFLDNFLFADYSGVIAGRPCPARFGDSKLPTQLDVIIQAQTGCGAAYIPYFS
jgi:hypothetical protein